MDASRRCKTKKETLVLQWGLRLYKCSLLNPFTLTNVILQSLRLKEAHLLQTLGLMTLQTESCFFASMKQVRKECQCKSSQSISTGLFYPSSGRWLHQEKKNKNKNRPASFIMLFKKTKQKKDVFDQLHTGIQRKGHKYWHNELLLRKRKEKKKINQIKLTVTGKTLCTQTRVWWTRQIHQEYIDSCVFTSATILLRSFHYRRCWRAC